MMLAQLLPKAMTLLQELKKELIVVNIEESILLKVLIELNARQAFPEEKLLEIVSKRKRNPASYIKGYNACDGSKGVTELARHVGVKQPTMSKIMQSWKSSGIIYENRYGNPVKLYTLKETMEVLEDDSKETGRPAGEDGESIGSDGSPDVEEQDGAERRESNDRGASP